MHDDKAARYYIYRSSLPAVRPTRRERAALAAGRREIARGEYATLEEVRAKYRRAAGPHCKARKR
jgi:predicted transcriptional regulator